MSLILAVISRESVVYKLNGSSGNKKGSNLTHLELIIWGGYFSKYDEKSYLIETCLNGEDTLKRLFDTFDISYDQKNNLLTTFLIFELVNSQFFKYINSLVIT